MFSGVFCNKIGSRRYMKCLHNSDALELQYCNIAILYCIHIIVILYCNIIFQYYIAILYCNISSFKYDSSNCLQ